MMVENSERHVRHNSYTEGRLKLFLVTNPLEKEQLINLATTGAKTLYTQQLSTYVSHLPVKPPLYKNLFNSL